MKTERCPGCRRQVLTREDAADHEECLHEYRQAMSREIHPDERSER